MHSQGATLIMPRSCHHVPCHVCMQHAKTFSETTSCISAESGPSLHEQNGLLRQRALRHARRPRSADPRVIVARMTSITASSEIPYRTLRQCSIRSDRQTNDDRPADARYARNQRGFARPAITMLPSYFTLQPLETRARTPTPKCTTRPRAITTSHNQGGRKGEGQFQGHQSPGS